MRKKIVVKDILIKALDSKSSFLWASILGVIIGSNFPYASSIIGHISEVIIDIMKMCVLPIVITSISLSIAHLTSIKSDKNVFYMIIVMITLLFICSFFGLAGAYLLKPGAGLDTSSSTALKAAVEDSAQSTKGISEPIDIELTDDALEILLTLIPSNIFAALSQNSILQVISFSIIFGIALGIFSKGGSRLTAIIKETLDIFNKIFQAITFIFPLVLICSIARDIASIGTEVLIGMWRFIGYFYLTTITLFIALSILMYSRTKANFSQWVNIIKEPVIIAIATQSSTASIPSSITAMMRFNFDFNMVQLLIPLGSIIGRFGNILYFSFCAMFALQLYDVDLQILDYALVSILTIFAGISTSGQSGILSITALSLVLTPVGIPFSGIYALLVAVDTLIDPARTLAIVHTSCATVALMNKAQGPPLSLKELENKIKDSNTVA